MRSPPGRLKVLLLLVYHVAKAKIISLEHQAEILACLSEQNYALETVLLYLLLRDTGLRISEAITLKFGLFWENQKIKHVLVIPGELRKGRKKALPVTVVLSGLFRRVLQLAANRRAEAGRCHAEDFLFLGRSDNSIGHVHRSTAARRLKALFVEALGEQAAAGMSTHSFRRTLATSLYRMNVRVEIIQRILGHKHVDTTLRYIEISINQLTEKQRELHRLQAESYRRHQVLGHWRSRGPRAIQLYFLDEEVGYKSLDDVFCTNEEADRALLQSLQARSRSTRCKPQPPRPPPRSRGRFGNSTE